MNEPKKEKVFVNGMIIREHKFTNGGTILKIGVKVDQLTEFLKDNQKESGWCNIIITRRQNPDEKSSHYATLDTYQKGDKPVGRGGHQPSSTGNLGEPPADYGNPPSDPNADDVPF